MSHTADQHFKMIVGLTVADLAEQLALARAQLEATAEELAALRAQLEAAAPPPEPPG